MKNVVGLQPDAVIRSALQQKKTEKCEGFLKARAMIGLGLLRIRKCVILATVTTLIWSIKACMQCAQL